MGGSAKGKQVKGKGKSKSRKSECFSRQPATSDPDVSQREWDNLSVFDKTKDEKLHGEINFKIDTTIKETKRALEILLYNKLDFLYGEALLSLVAKGLEIDKAQHGILKNGHWFGNQNLLENIVQNSINFLNSGVVTDKEAPNGYTSMGERVESLMRVLMREKQYIYPQCNEIDALKHLAGIGGGYGVVSMANPPSVQIENCRRGEGSANGSSGGITCPDTSHISKSVPAEDINEPSSPINPSLPEEEVSPTYAPPASLLSTSDDLDWEDPAILRLLEKKPEDEKDVLILSALKQHKDLTEQVKERKRWALEKAKEAELKVNSHISELQKLRTENLEYQQLKSDRHALYTNNMKRLREKNAALWNAMFQVEQEISTVRQHELQNSEVREHIERHRSDALRSSRALKEVERREKKSLKRIAAFENEKNLLQEQVEEEKQKIQQLKQELFQLKKAQVEAEAKLAEEVKGKELAIALVAEEERLRNVSEANLKAKQASLRRKAETDLQVLKDDLNKLNDEVAKLRISDKESFWLTIPEAYVLRDSPEKVSCRECVICSKNDVSILFLPCAHQVVCTKCNEEEIVAATCPCCHVQIDERVTIYGANS